MIATIYVYNSSFANIPDSELDPISSDEIYIPDSAYDDDDDDSDASIPSSLGNRKLDNFK